MRFKEILSRITGLSVPVFGVSWNPPEAERDRVRRILAFLEDRRVLYNPTELEIPQHCVMSVIEIREFLTSELGAVETSTPLSGYMRAMRSACRKFLDLGQARGPDVVRYSRTPGHWASWEFNAALGELRGVFGIHIAQMATQYGLDVEPDLAAILPAVDQEPARASARRTTSKVRPKKKSKKPSRRR
jgi:hypothetical protein